MKLSPNQQKLLGSVGGCAVCHSPLIKDYCRSCDEFIYVCDTEDTRSHAGHRKYLTGFQCTKCKCVGGCTCCTPDRCMCNDNGVELDDTRES